MVYFDNSANRNSSKTTVYLDNSATTIYKPTCVIEALQTAAQSGGNPGRSGHSVSMRAAENVFNTRTKVLSLFGNAEGNCIFTSGCTHALNLALFGLGLHGTVVTTKDTHNSTLRPLLNLSSRGFIRLVFASPDNNGDYTPHIRQIASSSGITCVVINAVSNVTGYAHNLKDIGQQCKSSGAIFIVDGAQAAGYINVDMTANNIDCLALAPHKGMHACMGVGALLLAPRITRISPLILGGTGIDSLNNSRETVLPDSLEAGTLPYPAIMSLSAACNWTKDNTATQGIHNLKLTQMLYDALENITPTYSKPNPSGVFSFNIKKMPPNELADILNSKGFCVRGGLHCAPKMHEQLGTLPNGSIRASVGLNNTSEEIESFIATLQRIIKDV